MSRIQTDMDLGLAGVPIRKAKPGRPHPKTKFTEEEDALLALLVRKYGRNSWELIARNIPNRNPRQCKERYKNYLDPSINKSPWTTEEDARLIATVKAIGTRWVELTTFFDRRTENQESMEAGTAQN